MMRRTWMWMSALSLAMLLSAGGCDEGGGSDNDDVRNSGDFVGDGTAATNSLVVENPAAGEDLKLVYNSDATIDVRYLSVDGSPIADAVLTFEIIQSTDDCGFNCLAPDALEAPTTGDGYVNMKVNSKDKDADILLRIAVKNNDSVPPAEVLIKVRAKDSYDLVVSFKYDGIRTFDGVKPLLFDGASSCADLFTAPLRDKSQLGQPAQRQNPDAPRAADGKISDSVFTSLGNNSSFTVVAYAVTSADLISVFGCNDDRPAVSDGSNTNIEVTLNEVPILVAGTYLLTSNYDLSSAFPRATNPNGFGEYEIGNYLDDIINLIKNPGQQIWSWLLAVPQIASILPDELTALGPVVGSILDNAITSFAPDWLGNALVIGEDVTKLLTSLQLEGELVINDEPDAAGKLPPGQIHRYFAITYLWNLPCTVDPSQTCGPITKTLREVTGDPTLSVEGTWTGSVTSDQLTVEKHGLLVPIGAIALGIFETVALPAIMGDANVNSLDKFIDALIITNLVEYYNEGRVTNEQVQCGKLFANAICTCSNAGDVLGNLVDADGGFLGGTVSTIGQYACEEGKGAILGFIRNFFNGINVDSSDGFVVSTTDPCSLHDLDGNLEFDAIGEIAARCNWQLDVTFNSGVDVYQGTGVFFGER